MAALKIGDKAPEFSLLNQNGDIINLKDYHGEKTIVLYFYPKDETPGCTAEACSFRDSYEDFKDAGAEVIGVSLDSPKSHKKFAERRRLPFQLLTDPRQKVGKAYGVKGSFLGLFHGRETFVIDPQGMIRHKFASQVNIGPHIKEALKVVQEIADQERLS
ncbi:MAG: peroxiredoxin [Bacteroidota bacterium]